MVVYALCFDLNNCGVEGLSANDMPVRWKECSCEFLDGSCERLIIKIK
jgi:hypothetical protein